MHNNQYQQTEGLFRIEQFGQAIFEHIARAWELDVSVGPVETRPCCDEITCDDETEYCQITLKRPRVTPFTYEANWYPGDIHQDTITAAWALKDATAQVAYLATQNLDETTQAAFEQFCCDPAGNEPQLWAHHLFSFVNATDALEYFVFPESIDAEVHGDER
jgi:hypothetical protein